MRGEATTGRGLIEFETKIGSMLLLTDRETGKSAPILMSADEVAALDSIVNSLKPKVAVEIGSWEGGSALLMAPYVGSLFCVDQWTDYTDEGGFDEPIAIRYGGNSPEEKFATFCRNLQGYLFKKVFPCRGSSKMWA